MPSPVRWSAFVAAPAIPSIALPRTARPAGPGARRPISPSPMTSSRRRTAAATMRRGRRLDVALGRRSCHAPAAEAVTPGRGQHAAAGRAVARPRRRLDQGRIAQSHLVVQGPPGLVRRSPWPGASAPRSIASSSSGNAGAAAAAYAAKAGLPCVVFTFVGSRRPAGAQMRAYGAMVVKVDEQGRPLAAADGRRARVRLVSDLAVLRPRGRQQSLWHGRLQDDRLRDRRGLRLEAARLVRPAGLLRRCAVRHVEGLRGIEGAGLDRSHAAPGRGRSLGLAHRGDGERRCHAARRPRNAASIATSIGASQGTVQAVDVLRRSKGVAVTIEDDEIAPLGA